MNARSAQLLAATLAFLLIVLVGALIFILLSRPAQGPRPSPSASPTTVAGVTASPLPTLSPSAFPSTSPGTSPTEIPTVSPEPFPSASPAPTPEITPEITPEVTPEITPEVTPEITPSLSPTPSPTPTLPPVPTSPGRQIRVDNLGLDGRNPEVGVERYVLFHVDGPSLIRVTLSNTTGSSRVCLWEGDNAEDPNACQRMRNGTRELAVFDAGQTSWTLSLIGIEQALGPVIDVTLDFNANSPRVSFENLRFQGQPVQNYNGIVASVDSSGPGELRVTGAFDSSQQHAYRVVIDEAGVGVVLDEAPGPANNFAVTQPVTAVTTYRVTVSNPNTSAEPQPVFLRATFTWP